VKPILVTADLHFQKPWFEWLIREASRFEAVLIAGDFLDIFIAEPRTAQAREAQSWLQRLSEVTKVAICSGNHDIAGHQITWDRAPVYEWLAELGQAANIITDGCTRMLDDLIITTVPYYCSPPQKAIWLDRGGSLRKSHPERKWAVLHHVPPPLRKSPMGEEIEAGELLNKYRPDYLISAHIHDLPYQEGNSWRKKIGETMVITPGQLLDAPFPNHVILYLPSGEGQWVTSRETE
jgi:Icc-related predicted phosphoesterase